MVVWQQQKIPLAGKLEIHLCLEEKAKVPKWNLTLVLVLAAMLGKPYELLEMSALKYLTHKTVFLASFPPWRSCALVVTGSRLRWGVLF